MPDTSFHTSSGSSRNTSTDWQPETTGDKMSDVSDSGLSTSYQSSSSMEIILDDMRASSFGFGERASTRLAASRTLALPTYIETKMARTSWEVDRDYHMSMLATDSGDGIDRANNVHLEEIRTTPIFAAEVLDAAQNSSVVATESAVFPQYGLLAERLQTYRNAKPDLLDDTDSTNEHGTESKDNRLFINVNTPWSAFICGSQGSGKSHTLSCMLETALLPSKLGRLPGPLAGMVFHYDKFTGVSSSQICEAAYLCSAGIPVRVVVSPSNYYRMKDAYENLPGLPPNTTKPTVVPLLLEEKQLNVDRMMNLMAVGDGEGGLPLYMEVARHILQQMAVESKGALGLNYQAFKDRLDIGDFNAAQHALIGIRLELLESFMDLRSKWGAATVTKEKPKFENTPKDRKAERKWEQEQDQVRKANIAGYDIWDFKQGSLTIVDLSCPFVDEGSACALFNICVALFLENRGDLGLVIALDEAHKFMSKTNAASTFTDSLLDIIRQQRHLATRIIIATQEPTISPQLLDLSSMTIVHRFTSPSWLQALRSHLAGVSLSDDESSKRDMREIFKTIVNLDAGQALLFSPSSMLAMADNHRQEDVELKAKKLGVQYIKMRVRKRLTADGGRSVLAA